MLEEHHGSAHGVCVLRLEVRIALDKTVCIHVFLGRVEILVVRPLDTSGVGEVEHQVLRVVVAQEKGREEVEIASRGAGAGALPVSEGVGVLAPESCLHRELIVEERLGKAYVCGCHLLAVSEVVPVVGQTGLGLEHLVVSHRESPLGTGLKHSILPYNGLIIKLCREYVKHRAVGHDLLVDIPETLVFEHYPVGNAVVIT